MRRRDRGLDVEISQENGRVDDDGGWLRRRERASKQASKQDRMRIG